jgi:hypothetical protein
MEENGAKPDDNLNRRCADESQEYDDDRDGGSDMARRRRRLHHIAQDKYAVKVPGGLAFSEFKGYEAWQTIAVSRNEKVVAVILGNPVMIDAYQAGFRPTVSLYPTGPGWPRFTGSQNRISSSRRRLCRANC